MVGTQAMINPGHTWNISASLYARSTLSLLIVAGDHHENCYQFCIEYSTGTSKIHTTRPNDLVFLVHVSSLSNFLSAWATFSPVVAYSSLPATECSNVMTLAKCIHMCDTFHYTGRYKIPLTKGTLGREIYNTIFSP